MQVTIENTISQVSAAGEDGMSEAALARLIDWVMRQLEDARQQGQRAHAEHGGSHEDPAREEPSTGHSESTSVSLSISVKFG